MESKYKKVLLIGIIVVVLFGLTLFISGMLRGMVEVPVSNQDSLYSNGAKDPEEIKKQQAKEKEIEETINKLSDTKNWKQFANQYCGISFSYPLEASVGVRAPIAEAPEVAKVCDFSVTATKSMPDVRFQFIIHPVSAPVNDEKYNPKKLTEATTKNWSAKQVAEEIAELNKNYVNINGDKSNVSAVEELSINGKNAYFFTIDRGLVDWRQGSHVFDQEVTLVYIADNKGKVYVIEYPSQDKLARLILESLKFTN